MTIKTTTFTSFTAFEESTVLGAWEHVAIITENGHISADLMTKCKSWETALRRFFKAVQDVPDLAEWADGLRESCENGYFEDCSQVWDGGKLTYTGDWAYCVENHDGAWYVSLTVRVEEPAPAPAPQGEEAPREGAPAAENSCNSCESEEDPPMKRYEKLFTLSAWTYAGQLVEFKIPENSRAAAAAKVREMLSGARAWIDIDEGICLQDESDYE